MIYIRMPARIGIATPSSQDVALRERQHCENMIRILMGWNGFVIAERKYTRKRFVRVVGTPNSYERAR